MDDNIDDVKDHSLPTLINAIGKVVKNVFCFTWSSLEVINKKVDISQVLDK